MVEQIVLRRDGAEHIAHGDCCLAFVARTRGSGAHNPILGHRVCGASLLVSFRGIGHDCESLAISATALTTFAAVNGIYNFHLAHRLRQNEVRHAAYRLLVGLE